MLQLSKLRKVPYYQLLEKVHGGIWKYRAFMWIRDHDQAMVVKCNPYFDDRYDVSTGDTHYYLMYDDKSIRISPYTAEII